MIKQAVILCGGLGTRLGHLTRKIPKPMVMVGGKPFLEHLIIQLKENGIKNFFLLVGFKKEKIINYFANGKKWNVKIEYSYQPPECDTAYRLFYIKKKIKEDFLLMYCDNYCSLSLSKIYNFFKVKKSLATLVLAKKTPGNIKCIANSNLVYSIKRTKNRHYVEIGYMILKKEFLNMLSNKNLNLSYYLKKISNKKKISGFKTHNNYLSISDSFRLKETRKFFRKKRYILIDRDGVINKKNPNFFYVRNIKELFFNEKIISVLQKFPKFKFICITNQAGIATGEVLKKNLNKINLKIKNYLKKKSINLIKFYVSEDHYNSNSFFRKPNPGNFIKAAKEYKILLDKTFYIGDDLRDVEAAYRANTKCFYIGDKKKINKKFNNIIAGNLHEALLRYY